MNNNLDKQYLSILHTILKDGHEKKSRTGVNTLSVFGTSIRHKMDDGFPLLTSKKVAWKTSIKEMLWFLSGSSDIRDLWKRNVYIWDGDWYSQYSKSCSTPYSLEKMKEFASSNSSPFDESIWDLGPLYGVQWRGWKTEDGQVIDQFKNLLYKLKNNPDSRRMLVNSWNVGQLDQMTLPPCHYSFEVYTRKLTLKERMDYWFRTNKPNRNVVDEIDGYSIDEQHQALDKRLIPERSISLKWTQRSADFPLGVPFNLVCYGSLLLMLGDEFNMVPEDLIGSFGDSHIYVNQVEGVKKQLTQPTYLLPKVKVKDGIYSTLNDFHFETDYVHSPEVKFPLSN